ncbi:MAG: hypothetical protein QOH21_1472 [Acidobacteriota bacterium]|nr:hypothetical protein [Acidobacteriota bacterium]
MLDLATSQTLSYQSNGTTYTIVVYADTDVKTNSTYYIVPQPAIATGTNGQPAFSLLQIESGSDVSGQCNFQSVLITPPGSVTFVQQHFQPAPGAPPINIGALGWSGGVAYFNYEYPVNGQSQPFQAVAYPSLQPTTVVGGVAQATGSTAWSIQLPTQAAVQAFVGAFGPQSVGNSFSLEYQMQVPGSLPGVTATVAFDSTIAYQFQQQISVSTNVWGDVTSETVTIQQYLNQSQAGSIDFEWGAIDPQSPLGLQVQNWASQTLQNNVQSAVNNAMSLISGNRPSGTSYNFSMSEVASFSTVYSSNQVVTWFTHNLSTLASFSAAAWAGIFQTINTAPLTVVCSLQNAGLTNLGISSVTFQITSPSGNGSGTVTDEKSAWTFSVPAVLDGQGQPNFSYTYTYTVQYTNTQGWTSQPVTANAATSPFVQLNPGALRALAVSFATTNIKFGKAQGEVNFVEVDFTFTNTNTPAGVDAQTVTQSRQFFANDVPWKVQFPTALPYNTTYMYSARYVMADGTTIRLAPQSGNADNVFLTSPLRNRVWLVSPNWGSGVTAISNLIVQASYVDPDNEVDVQQNLWTLADAKAANTPWMFLAPQNPNAYADVQLAQFTEGGETIVYPLPWQIPTASINISGSQTPFMVTVDPSLIDWNANVAVLITLYLKDGTGAMQQQNSHKFIKGVGSYPYTFLVSGAASLTWYYTLQYWPTAGAAVNTSETKMTGQILILPRTFTKTELMANVQPFLSPETHARELQASRARLFTGRNLSTAVAGAAKGQRSGPPLSIA